MTSGMEHLSFVDKLRELGWFRLEKRRSLRSLSLGRPCYGLSANFNGAYRKDRDIRFSRACSGMTRGNGFKVKEDRFRLDLRKKFFMIRVVKHWHRLLREVVNGQCRILGKVQGQMGWGSDHPDLVKNDPAYCRDFVLAEL